ncbi:unnamed protein product [Closterium sp. Yama58-4]|nr:unnamed protein product [Closterium sp. Yama58-4]
MKPLSLRTTVVGDSGFLPNQLAGDPSGGEMRAMEQLELERGVCNPFKKYTPEMVRARAFSSPSAFLGILLRGTEIVWELTMFFLSLSYDKLMGLDDRNVPTRAAQLRRLLCRLGPSFIKSGQVLANRPDIIREDYMNELCILQDDVPAFPTQVSLPAPTQFTQVAGESCLLCRLGPSFIKLGQVLANRPDIIREDYMNELCILQDDVPAFPTQEAFAIIEANMGVPLEETFSAISPEPVAAASLGQVYRARLRASGAEVAVKVLRPGIEPVIYRDLFLFRTLASFLNGISIQKLGCNAELIVDEFGEKLLEELDYRQEARNIQSFYENFLGDPTVKIPLCYSELSGERVLVMEWIDGIRCTDPQAIRAAGIDTEVFLTVGVSAALRQLLEFGLFHGDPHPGNIFAMRDGRIAYVDFGNVAELSQYNKEILIDAIVHAVNEDYVEMAGDFTRLGFLAPGTDVTPIVPALEAIWQNSTGQSLADFNFRTVTRKFNQLVYNFPIRIPERFSLVIRSLLTQEGICLSLEPNFKFLEVAYPYVAKRLLTDPDPALRSRLIQVLFKDGVFQWKRLENLITLAKEQVALANRARNPDGTFTAVAVAAAATPAPAAVAPNSRFFPLDPAAFGSLSQLALPIPAPAFLTGLSTTGPARAATSAATSAASAVADGGLDLRETIRDGARVLLMDPGLRRQILLAFTQDSRLHVKEVMDLYRLVADDLPTDALVGDIVEGIPSIGRDLLLSWSDSILERRRDSLHAVDWAIENHLRPSDLVTMLHVQSPTEALTAPGIYAAWDSDAGGAALGDTTMSEAAMDQLLVRTEERQSAVNAELKRLLLQRCSNAELQCEVRVVRDADPRERIVSEVADTDADVLILGSRGMGPVKRMLIGSVSDYCVNHAPCPVVVVKPSAYSS